MGRYPVACCGVVHSFFVTMILRLLLNICFNRMWWGYSDPFVKFKVSFLLFSKWQGRRSRAHTVCNNENFCRAENHCAFRSVSSGGGWSRHNFKTRSFATVSYVSLREISKLSVVMLFFRTVVALSECSDVHLPLTNSTFDTMSPKYSGTSVCFLLLFFHGQL